MWQESVVDGEILDCAYDVLDLCLWNGGVVCRTAPRHVRAPSRFTEDVGASPLWQVSIPSGETFPIEALMPGRVVGLGSCDPDRLLVVGQLGDRLVLYAMSPGRTWVDLRMPSLKTDLWDESPGPFDRLAEARRVWFSEAPKLACYRDTIAVVVRASPTTLGVVWYRNGNWGSMVSPPLPVSEALAETPHQCILLTENTLYVGFSQEESGGALCALDLARNRWRTDVDLDGLFDHRVFVLPIRTLTLDREKSLWAAFGVRHTSVEGLVAKRDHSLWREVVACYQFDRERDVNWPFSSVCAMPSVAFDSANQLVLFDDGHGDFAIARTDGQGWEVLAPLWPRSARRVQLLLLEASGSGPVSQELLGIRSVLVAEDDTAVVATTSNGILLYRLQTGQWKQIRRPCAFGETKPRAGSNGEHSTLETIEVVQAPGSSISAIRIPGPTGRK